MKSKCLLVITGPTAVGKTEVSVEIARHFRAEIISADARQFYRELHIGTAVPPKEVLASVPHHFIGHLSISDYYNVALYEQEALKLLDKLFRYSDYALVVGGSGLYIDTLCRGIDPMPDHSAGLRKEVHQFYKAEGLAGIRAWLKQLDPDYFAQVDPGNPQRIMRAIEVCLAGGKPFSAMRVRNRQARPFSIRHVVLNRPRAELFSRINERVDNMIADGLIEEAMGLFEYRHLNALNTVGYRELYGWVSNRHSLADAIAKIKTNTRRYAKRQLTWFKKYEDAAWVHPEETSTILQHLEGKG
ncbi:MAG: tRNA (adenosine(37)-N6)-dimethylallyltransferase MiaA [Bacteroidales bacterium]|nr:tRNA (adenosine(37)-N6)-dimethylallyltransferase MiaA [Bacteroidales bacterium]